MDVMRMNEGNVSECPIVEEEPNADHSKLSAIAQMFTIKSDYGLSEASYDKIIK
jgi:hypothetical protein